MFQRQELLAAHHRLDFECRNRGGRLFVSDWYCEHPFAESILSTARRSLPARAALDYYFQNDQLDLHEEIVRFHDNHSEAQHTEGVFVSAGLSSLITAQMLLLRRRRVSTLYYIRPLYYTYYFLAESLGIDLVPVNEHPLLGEGTDDLRLPGEREQWLVLCDPVWYLGRAVHQDAIDALRKWQLNTRGFVIVDGAFQYQRWDENDRPERTHHLVHSQTMRNLCPTKAAAVHGPRFAYSLLPPAMNEELRYCYSNSAGSGSIFDLYAAVDIMKWLNSDASNTPLLDYISRRYRRMCELGLLEDPVGAVASYFCFVKLPVPRKYLITMGQEFFEAYGRPGHARFNLILPSNTLEAYVRLGAATLGLDADWASEYIQ